MSDEKSWWSDPAIWIALIALGISGYQAITSHLNNKASDRRTKYIESIAVEFAEIEKALDRLEQDLVRAKRNAAISSSDIAGLAVKAMRTTTRCLNRISDFKTVDASIIELKRIDALDEVMTFANNGEFDGPTRNLHLDTSRNVVVRVSIYCERLSRDIKKTHLS